MKAKWKQISLCQFEVEQANVEANLLKGETYIQEAAHLGSDLICFPEMWTTGFDYLFNQKNCTLQDVTIAHIAKLAHKYGIAISGSVLSCDSLGKQTNTQIVMDCEGKALARYDKIHLFGLMGEDKFVSSGDHLTLLEMFGEKIGLSICYDLRFSAMYSVYANSGVTVVLSPMAFPYPRLEHYQTLVKARAIEFQLFMIVTNRVGSEQIQLDDTTEVNYFGRSCVIDPWGNVLGEAGEQEELLTISLDLNKVHSIRELMPIQSDARPEAYNFA